MDVWNPAYASNAMEAHLAVLLQSAAGTDPHVWWGKVRSANRRQELKHLPQILEIAAELAADPERECHLYLTDYRALYVGQVDEIAQEDVRERDRDHVPAYYTEQGLQCDFWYRLLDLRRLVADDTEVVIARLRTLRNLGYDRRPVSLYGGMVDLPLIVERTDDDDLFAPDAREAASSDRLWAQIDREAVGVGTMERELRENLLGDEAWLALDPAARTFIASAERVLRDQRADPGFDYGAIVTPLAKAVEVTCNAILRRVGPQLPREVRTVTIDRQPVDVGAGKALTLGQLAHVLRTKGPLHRQLRQRLDHGDWFVDVFPAVVGQVADVRNPAVHSKRIDRETALGIRNMLVGVGCQGTFVDLARVRLK